MLRILLIPAALFIFLITSCQNGDSRQKMDGHARMVAILDSINRNANPMGCLNLNRRKAELYLQQMQSAAGNEAVSAKFNYADQLLKSGQNEAAIMQFKELIQMAGDQLNPQTKILYELLALSYMRIGNLGCTPSPTRWAIISATSTTTAGSIFISAPESPICVRSSPTGRSTT